VADPEYFTLAEFRALPDMDNTTTYTEAKVLAEAAAVTAIIERECQTSFIARTVTDERHDGGCHELILAKPYVLSVTSATENGTAVTDTLRVKKNGVMLRYATGSYTPKVWLSGFDNVTVSYQAGYSATVPTDLKTAAMQATRYRLITKAAASSMNERATSITNEFGNINLLVANADHPFGLPDADSVIVGYRNLLRPAVAG
jgi:hypothetical protein